MESKHFSHHHPLAFHHLPQPSHHHCSGCKFPATGNVYACWQCSYFLHDQCFRATRSLNHPSHPLHPLTLLPFPTYPSSTFICNSCNLAGEAFSYTCSACEFDIHLHCALHPNPNPNPIPYPPPSPVPHSPLYPPPNPPNHSHVPHNPIYPPNPNPNHSHLPQDPIYPPNPNPSSNPHQSPNPLYPPNSNPNHSHLPQDPLYPPNPIPSSNPHQSPNPIYPPSSNPHQSPNPIHPSPTPSPNPNPTPQHYPAPPTAYPTPENYLPPSNPTTPPPPPPATPTDSTVITTTAAPASPPPSIIKHFSHPHVLKQMEIEKNKAKICSACEIELTGAAFCCTEPYCTFNLHKSCFESPREVKHKSHLQHPLTLLAAPPYSDGFTCNACLKDGKAFAYNCAKCSYDLHIDCIQWPDTVNRPDHKHNLTLYYSSPAVEAASEAAAFVCDVCKNPVHEMAWLYYCRECDFGTHLECVASGIQQPGGGAAAAQSEEEELLLKFAVLQLLLGGQDQRSSRNLK